MPSDVLLAKNTWADKQAYDRTAADVARRFEENFKQYADQVDEKVRAAGIRRAAA